MLAFLVLSAIWVDAHGIHDAANSIGHLVTDTTTEAYTLTYFFDETVGHWLWHAGVIGLSVLLVWTERRYGGEPTVGRWPLAIAGLIYGLTFFLIVVEGQTVLLGFPFAVLFVATSIVVARDGVWRRPLLTFFLIGHLVAALLFAGWGLYWGGFPELSEKGLF